MPFWLWVQTGPRDHVSDVVQIPHGKGEFWRKGAPTVKYRDFLPCAVQKWLNRSTCHLGCGLGWAKGSTSSIVFAKWHQCALMGGHNGATWQIRLNRSSAAAMRPYVKLLWPLVIISTIVLVVGLLLLLPLLTTYKISITQCVASTVQ